jgi:hypothetical protein
MFQKSGAALFIMSFYSQTENINGFCTRDTLIFLISGAHVLNDRRPAYPYHFQVVVNWWHSPFGSKLSNMVAAIQLYYIYYK